MLCILSKCRHVVKCIDDYLHNTVQCSALTKWCPRFCSDTQQLVTVCLCKCSEVKSLFKNSFTHMHSAHTKRCLHNGNFTKWCYKYLSDSRYAVHTTNTSTSKQDGIDQQHRLLFLLGSESSSEHNDKESRAKLVGPVFLRLLFSFFWFFLQNIITWLYIDYNSV